MPSRRRGIGLVVLAACLLLATGISAAQQPVVPDRDHPRQVFIERDVGPNGADRLIFVDLLTGEERPLDVDGDRYIIAHNGVLYLDRATRRVLLAAPTGSIIEHPFIQPGPQTRRIDWLVSNDGRSIAWTLTEGTPSALATATWVADIDGTNARQVLADGPRDGIRAFPVAFDEARATLFMDYQPDTIGDITPFRQYAGLFSVDLATGEAKSLPGEPGCFCGAGINAGYFLRLALAENLAGFSLRAYALTSGQMQTIPGPDLTHYTQGGDVLIAPDGTRAVYALSQVLGFGTTGQTAQTIYLYVDLVNMAQRVLIQPTDLHLKPIAWTEDNSAVLYSDPTQNGTWKITIADSSLTRVARATFLGTLLPR